MTKRSEQISHLNKDKFLKKVIARTGHIPLKRDTDLYLSLLRAIVGQQLSTKAANTIWGRFIALFRDGYPTAQKLLKLNDETLRAAGLSYQKAGYLKNIARFSIDHTLDYKQLRSMADEKLIEHLVCIKGVGRWTVEMILMFNLNREDILPIDDLGIQKGMAVLYGIGDAPKKTLHGRIAEIAESWRPYRTLACMYIWRHKDSG